MRPVKVGADAVAAGLVDGFRASGYAGASMRDLCAATGLRSASLYHRFGDGKQGMAAAALDHAGDAFAAQVVAPLTAPGDPSERLATSAAGVAGFYAGGELACLLAVLTLSDAPEAVRARIAAAFARWRDALAAVLGEAGAAEADALAQDRIAALQGALILARAGQGRDAFARAVARLGATP